MPAVSTPERSLTFSRSSVIGRRLGRAKFALIDFCVVMASAGFVYNLRFPPDWVVKLLYSYPLPAQQPLREEYLGFLILYGGLVLIFCHTQGLYSDVRSHSAFDEAIGVVKAVTLATLLLTAIIYLSGTKTISRLVVGSAAVLNTAVLAAWRVGRQEQVKRRAARGEGQRNVLIVGTGRVAEELADYLNRNSHLGYVVRGFLAPQSSSDHPKVLGGVEDFGRVAQVQFIDEVVVTTPSDRALVGSIVLQARERRIDVKVVPELYDGLGWRAPIEYLGDYPVMTLHREPIPDVLLGVKRLLDIGFSALALLLLSPFLLVIAVAIQLDSPGPTIYRSPRVGKKGRIFTCYKFRTMVPDADDLKRSLRALNERQGPFFKITNDPRLTRLGRFLRQYSFDELPQFWNVLKGDMSLVGPRPHPIDDYRQYSLEHLRRLDVLPGITGLWQVSSRQDPSFEKNMALDLEYIENWSIWLDLKILLRTIPTVVAGSGE